MPCPVYYFYFQNYFYYQVYLFLLTFQITLVSSPQKEKNMLLFLIDLQ